MTSSGSTRPPLSTRLPLFFSMEPKMPVSEEPALGFLLCEESSELCLLWACWLDWLL